jgi:hypothetical protein
MARRLSARAVGTLAAALLVTLGCGGSPDELDAAAPDAGADGGPGGPPITNLTAVQSPDNVLAYTVEFESPVAGRPELTVACAGVEPWTLAGEVEDTRHEVFVTGLVAETSCTFTAALADPTAAAPASLEVEVAPLPAYLPEVEVIVADDGAALEGWTLFNLSNGREGYAYTVALVDLAGRYRWYYQYPGAWHGADSPVLRFGRGVLVGGRGIPITEIGWDGRQVWSGPTGHHEVRPSREPGRVYYLTDEAPCNGQTHGAGGIVEWDYEAGEEVWRWFMCEHYTPPADVADWSHLNTVVHTLDGEGLIISSRNQNALMRVDRASGTIEWTMGFGGRVEDGFGGDFEMSEADRFYQQHDPQVLEDGHLVLFDNGHPTERPYSRAIEIEYTHDPSGTSTASVVWEYRHDPDLYTPIWGDADRLENGNTLVTFGRSDAIDRTRVVEVTAAGEVAWEIAVPLYWGIYRSDRVTDVPRGFVRE